MAPPPPGGRLSRSPPAVLLAAMLGAALLAGCTGGPEPEPSEPWSFEVYHYDSRFGVEGAPPGWAQEVFRVHRVGNGTPAPLSALVFRDNGEPRGVTWDGDTDGVVSAGDRLWFFAEPHDPRQELVATWNGTVVMRCGYGGGAGNPVEPGELAAVGLLRCL